MRDTLSPKTNEDIVAQKFRKGHYVEGSQDPRVATQPVVYVPRDEEIDNAPADLSM